MQRRVIIAIICAACTFPARGQYIMDSLLENCYVGLESTREIFVEKSNNKQLLKSVVSQHYRMKLTTDTLFSKPQNLIPASDMISTVWPLIKKQLKGTKGTLSIEYPNWFLTNTRYWHNCAVIVTWDKQRERWGIIITRLKYLNPETVRIFYRA
jgi:hypothetical protein